nr:MobB protein [Rahnella sp. WMR104]
MNETTPLAERLKQQRAAENASLASLTQQQLSDLRSGLTDILQDELSTMRRDMEKQLRDTTEEFSRSRSAWLLSIVKHRVLFPALSTITVLGVIFLSGWGMSTYQESRIVGNWATISSQNATVLHLESRTAGVDIVRNDKGVFVVLPKGSKAENGWTVGKQDALRITR